MLLVRVPVNWSSYSTFGTPWADEVKTPVVNWKVHAPLQFTTGKFGSRGGHELVFTANTK